MRRLVMVLVMALGCGGDDEATQGELCDEIGDAYCARLVSCGAASYNQCFQAIKTACCIDDNVCHKDPPAGSPSLGDLRKICRPAIEALTCDEASKGVLPAACLML
ncbi:MAG TPA: hypothetical protein VD948_10230 [Rhodothermales bacterium]|nr:hypothetical protein [Rhodothermales bacterium]